MLKKITIKDIASFDKENGDSFAPTLINFIYGSNGSGKTTISNVIANCSAFPSCNLDWGLDAPLQTLVYNRTFIENNFEQSSELKGIFTLGKDSKDEEEKIKANQAKIEEKGKSILEFKKTLENEEQKNQTTENNFKDRCWNVQLNYEKNFINAFAGHRGSKEKFKEKVITEFTSNKQSLVALTELEVKANQILNSEATKVPDVREYTLPDLKTLEESPIFQTSIIGKDDVDIAKIILKLNNSDWVRQGIEFYKANDEHCPFCQQTTTESFRKQLDEYFDESYTQQIQTLKTANDKYNLECGTLLNTIANYITLNNQFLDSDALKVLKELISSKHQKNLLTLEKKIKEPTSKVELDSIKEHINKLKEIIDQAIIKTKEHNKLIDNIDSERKLLISQIWAFIINELKAENTIYTTEKDAIHKAKTGVETKLKATEGEIRTLEAEIQLSESKITSV